VPGAQALGWQQGFHISSFFGLHRFLILALQLFVLVALPVVAPGGQPVPNWGGFGPPHH
jgi:hypothetical protein